ncbi:T9SS type A sorting domain-containing protein [Urechidicola croceus]|nr:T9SS type A sorting domain-containing protein [Urechidicola croceus]
MKKILLILLLLTSSFVFAQQNQKEEIAINSEVNSINNLTAFPNPFIADTRISFSTNKSQSAILTIKNLLGKTIYKAEIKTKVGYNAIQFYKNNFESGMYIYSIQTGSEIVSKRLVIK